MAKKRKNESSSEYRMELDEWDQILIYPYAEAHAALHISSGDARVLSNSGPAALLLRTLVANKHMVLTRAAYQDLDDTASSKRRRIFAVAMHVGRANDETESMVRRLAAASFRTMLREFRFVVLDVRHLPRGSYGAIIFVESEEPTTRQEGQSRLQTVISSVAHEIGKELKNRVVKGTVTLLIGAGGYMVIDGIVFGIKCEPERAKEVDAQIIDPRDAAELQRIVNEHCSVKMNDFAEMIDQLRKQLSEDAEHP
jgi:hypothetical protein